MTYMGDKVTRNRSTGGKRKRKGIEAPDPIIPKNPVRIPTADQEGNRIKCRRCGRLLAEGNFMKRNGQPMDVCKDCIYSGCDNMQPETFKWVLQRYNVPFIRDKWIELAARAYFKDPKKFSSRSVIGTYIRTMGMKQYINYGFIDSEQLTEWYQNEYGNPEIAGQPLWSQITLTDLQCADDTNGKRIIDTVQSIGEPEPEQTGPAVMSVPNHSTANQQNQLAFQERIKLENQRIIDKEHARQEVESRYDWGLPIDDESNYENEPQISHYEENLADVPIPDLPQPNFNANIAQYRVINSQDPNEQKIKDQLTDEDIAMLAGKWGANYLPSEWMQMEELYERYEQEYELTADRAEALKKMCKVSLKMDQALENGETTEYKQLSSVYDQLRKSAKFTEAQKEEKKDKYLDSIGQLVAVLEREGGPIPAFDYKVETTQDIVDYTLRDMQKYTYSLVKKELGLGELIERYIAQLEESQRTQEELAKAADLSDIESSINDSLGEDIPDEELSIEDLVERDIEDMDNWG